MPEGELQDVTVRRWRGSAAQEFLHNVSLSYEEYGHLLWMNMGLMEEILITIWAILKRQIISKAIQILNM